MPSPRTVDQRLSSLERFAFETTEKQRETDAHLQHLTSAVGELSQAVRANTHQLGEIEQTIADHTVRFERIEAVQREHTARFDQVDERFDRVDGRLDRVEARLDRMDVMLTAILDHLGVAVPPATEGSGG